MAPRDLALIACVSIACACSLIACDKRDATKGPESSAGLSRDKLVARLIAKGDEFATKDDYVSVDGAQACYSLAIVYSPDDRNLAKKYERFSTRLPSIDRDMKQRVTDLVQNVKLDYSGWAKPSAEMERTELRILVDGQLLRDLKRGSLTMNGQKSPSFFYSKPWMTLSQVRQAYGEPQSERKLEGGGRAAWYGRILIIVDEGDKYMGVFYSPTGTD